MDPETARTDYYFYQVLVMMLVANFISGRYNDHSHQMMELYDSAIMHHPPDWLLDQDDFDDALWNGCALHLIGHKHRQRYIDNNNGIRVAAAI